MTETGINTTLAADSGEGDDPSRRCDALARLEKAWRMIGALMGGTDVMRQASYRDLLPQWPHEKERAYEIRRSRSTLFPAYARTVSILTGKPFSKPITYGDDVPPKIKGWLEENADLEGRNLDVFAAEVFAEALTYGICGILVDSPPNGGARTVAEEQQLGIRPYLVHVKHDAILGWRSENRGGESRLTQLRIMETVEEPVGRFGVKHVEQVRVLEPGSWSTYRKSEANDGKESWVQVGGGGTSVDFIPFVPVYGKRKEFMVGEPAMLDLAHLNVLHWQSSSDQQTILSTARIPILLLKGMAKDDEIGIGPGAFIQAESKDADAKFVEHTGSAIEAGRLSILDTEDQMRQVGAELLIIKPGNTTEVQTRSDNEPAMCDLQRISRGLRDGLGLSLKHMAEFAGEKSGGHVEIYDEYGVMSQSDATAQLLVDMNVEGKLSDATTLQELKRRGTLSADLDVAAEIVAARLERDAMQAKAAERERAMLMSNLADAADREMAADPIPYLGQPTG